MLARCLEWADETGLAKVSLKVQADNTKAIALYRRYGFESEGLLKMDKLLPDGYHDTLVMARFGQAHRHPGRE